MIAFGGKPPAQGSAKSALGADAHNDGGGRAHGLASAPLPAISSASSPVTCIFEAAMNGVAKDEWGPLSLFDRARVNRWWSRDVPQFFGAFPSEWLPLPRERNASGPLPSSTGEVA
jgi:hypothetical protein